MRQIIPEARFYACQRVARANETITLTHQNQIIRAKEDFFMAHPDGVAEVEGVIIFPPSLRGKLIHIDLFRDRTHGIFTLSESVIKQPLDYFPLCAIWHRTKKMTSHLGTQGYYSERLLEVKTEIGLLCVHRNHDTLWGPHRFRGRDVNWGMVTVMIS